ncbi:MAG: SpoIIIAH-like family protein [Clostridia bacterium]|nr:SpoIIIAH-like family protein [Clostridia bacterium]
MIINMNLLRKNQVIIYTFALMLVTAGYLNYTSNISKNAIETSAKEISQDNIVNESLEESNIASESEKSSELNENNEEEKDTKNSEDENIENIADNNEKKDTENIADNNEKKDTENNANKNIEKNENYNTEKNFSNNNDNKTEKVKDEETEKIADIGDATLVSSNDVVTDYYAKSKLERDSMYSQMIETYEKILNSSNSLETQKQTATQEITKINEIKNKTMICENLIQTKGFENCVIFINDESVSIVIRAEKLNTEEIAKIQNIISREFKVEIENIHISTK